MKTSTELGGMQSASSNPRIGKLDRTQRFSKQLSQGSSNFSTKISGSTKNIVRLSENSLAQKQKTMMVVSNRAGSIPKAGAREAREFGREINQNNAMSTVTQQTGQIMQGKLKPNVSALVRERKALPLQNSSLNLSVLMPQQVSKKNIMTYRTISVCEKPVSLFNSATSLGPLHSAQNQGPGQKFQQQPQLNQFNKSRSLLSSNDNLHTTNIVSARVNNMSLSHCTTSSVAHIVPKSTTAKETPMIKLQKVKEAQGNDKPALSEEESKGTYSANGDTITSSRTAPSKANETANKESVAELFKQRITQWRKSISKGMVFSD